MRKSLVRTKAAWAVVVALALVWGTVGCIPEDTLASGESGFTSYVAEDGSLTGLVKTGGSTSVEKVMNALIYQFQDDNRAITIDYEGNGSGDGIANTISGMYEIGHSSRELKDDGTEEGLDVIPYAIDGIALVVNPRNPVNELNRDQVHDIFVGKIKNWSEVGGGNTPIVVVTREEGSGTRDAFAEIIGLEKGGSNIIASASVANNTGAIQTQIAANANAIGFMSYADIDTGKVKPLAYDGVEISATSLKDGTYELKREFFLLKRTGTNLSPGGQAFIDFVLSEQGQQIVTAMKLLPID